MNEEKLFELISSFEFEELNEADQSLVMKEISVGEYIELRNQVNTLSFDDQHLHPPINPILLKKTKKNRARSIPIRYVASIAVIMFFAGAGLSNLLNREQQTPQMQLTDISKQSWKQDTVLTSLFENIP